MSDFKKQNFNRDSRSSGRFSSPRDRAPRELFPAVCGTCNNNCQVPFEPSSDKPVLCDACFKNSRQQPSFENRSSSPRSFSRAPRINSFSQKDTASSTESASFYFEKVKKQIEEMNQKLDKISLALGIDLGKKISSEGLKGAVSQALTTESEPTEQA